MSKDKPETGDIWNYEGVKRVVLAEGIKTCDFFGVVEAIQCLSDTGVIHWYNAKLFVKQAEYLGKSKVNISDLFKTENE